MLIIGAQIAKWFSEQITGNIVSVSQAGNVERFVLLPNGSYNAPIGSASLLIGNPTSGLTLKRGDGTTLSFGATTYTTPAKITQWKTAAGGTINYNYNGTGYLMSVVNPSTGRQLNFHYTGTQLTSVDDNTGALPRTMTFRYDGSNNLTAVTDPMGFITAYVYGAVGQLTSIYYPTHPTSAFVTMTYDTLGRPNEQWDAAANATKLYFAGARTEIDDPLGTARVSYFDPFGRTLATLDGLGSSDINNGNGNLTSYGYDGQERVSSVTYPADNGVAFTYDAYSNPLTVTQNPGSGSSLTPLISSFTYTSPVAALPNFEAVQTATNPLGLVTTYSYDTNGNRIRMVADAGATPHFNAVTAASYDPQGRVLTATDPLGAVTQYTYDSLGNRTTITRDAGRLNQVTQMSYDAVGNITSLTDPNGNLTTSTYDLDRRLSSTILPFVPSASAPLVSSFSYDADGRLLQTRQSVAGAVLRMTGSTYTLTGKPATASDANGNVTRYAYDADDRLATLTDAVGRTTSFFYDSLSRAYQVRNTAISANPLVQYAYTPNGERASLADANGNTTNYGYDGLDRLATTTFPGGSTETLSYDADSNVTTRKTRRGDTIAFAYDTLNRLCTETYATSAVACGGSSTNYLARYAYDLDGRLIAANDNSAVLAVPGTAASYATSYAYDALNRPLAVNWSPAPAQAAPTASSSTFAFGYDATNRRISQNTSDKSWWSYPTAASSTSYTANNLNQYSAVGSVSPTYDGNGNLTYDGTYTYAYDAENRLTAITQGGNPVASYAYDAQGRRKAKTAGGTTTVYATDADNREVLEYDGTSGVLGRWYAYNLGPDGVLGQMNIALGTRRTMIPDTLGSIVATLDSGTGALSKTGYQTFGENPALTSGTYQYTARRFDPETAGSAAEPSGLYYYRARHYSPTLGRFLQTDLIGYAGGTNLYAYVGNDPLNRLDPFGLDYQLSAGVGGTLAAAIGIGGSFTGGVNIPDNPLNIGGYQIFVTLQGNAMLGVGTFGGAGIQAGFARSTGPLPALVSTDTGGYREVDLGNGPTSASVSVQASHSTVTPSTISGGSFGLPLRAGVGLGAYAATVGPTGTYGSVTLSTPTVPQAIEAINSAANAVTSAFNYVVGDQK